MFVLRLTLAAALATSSISCIPELSDALSRRGPEDFTVSGTLTRTLEGCSTTYTITNVGDAAPSCYKCLKFQTGASTSALAFVLSPVIDTTSCDNAIGLGSTPVGISQEEDGSATVHMFDWTEPKSFAAWKELGAVTMTGDAYNGSISGSDLDDPVTRADALSIEMSWSVDEKLDLSLEVCPEYEGEETEVPYSWLGDGACDPQLECAAYNFDGGDCDPIGSIGDDDDALPPQCEDDELEDNDSLEEASQLPGGSAQGLMACAGDSDFFVLPVQAGQAVQVELTFNHAAGDIDTRLLDDTGGELTQGTSTDDNETMWWTAEQTGPLYIEVRLFDEFGSNVYGLEAWAN